VAKAIFTCKEIKKLPDDHPFSLFAHSDAELAWFAENAFVRHGPRHGGDGYCQDEEPNDFGLQVHMCNGGRWTIVVPAPPAYLPTSRVAASLTLSGHALAWQNYSQLRYDTLGDTGKGNHYCRFDEERLLNMKRILFNCRFDYFGETRLNMAAMAFDFKRLSPNINY